MLCYIHFSVVSVEWKCGVVFQYSRRIHVHNNQQQQSNHYRNQSSQYSVKMLRTYELIDRSNSVFCSYIVCSAVLVLKMLAMSTLTSIHRFRTQVNFSFYKLCFPLCSYVNILMILCYCIKVGKVVRMQCKKRKP